MGDLIIAASNKEISVWKPLIKKKQIELGSMNIFPQKTTKSKNGKKKKKKKKQIQKKKKNPV